MARLLICGLQTEGNALPAFGEDEHALLAYRVSCEKLAIGDHLLARRAPKRAQRAIDGPAALIREERAPDDLADCSFPGHLSQSGARRKLDHLEGRVRLRNTARENSHQELARGGNPQTRVMTCRGRLRG
jgi:hypothetical protein